METIQRLKATIRDVPDFPRKGIIFKDITPILQDARLFAKTIELFADHLSGKKIDYIAGIESRGFIFGSALAIKLNCGFVPIRKPGKLPSQIFSESYELEYGTDTLEIHQDAFPKGSKVCLIDDLLATGGTAEAAVKLIRKCEVQLIEILFLIELNFLKGRDRLVGESIVSLIRY